MYFTSSTYKNLLPEQTQPKKKKKPFTFTPQNDYYEEEKVDRRYVPQSYGGINGGMNDEYEANLALAIELSKQSLQEVYRPVEDSIESQQYQEEL